MVLNANFLFIDLEWEQYMNRASDNDRILEIGATMLGKEAEFIKYIKPGYPVRKRIWNLLNLSKKQLDEGITLEEAMSALSDYAGDVGIVMVWSQSTKRKLGLLANKYGHKNLIKNVIVLQDILMEHMKTKDAISFDNALIAMEIKYDPRVFYVSSMVKML